MKTVCIVIRYRIHEDEEIYEVFDSSVSASECCRLRKLEDDGYFYYWSEWEVK